VAGATEEPDIDRVTGPLRGINATFSIVEAIAIGVGSRGLHTAPLTALTDLTNHGATATSMHSHLILRLVVDPFYNVNLAIARPVGTSHPEGRPDPTSVARHVLQIEDDETVGVLVGAGDADAVTASASTDFGGIGLDGDDTTEGADQACALSGALVNVIDIAVSWVIFLHLQGQRCFMNKGPPGKNTDRIEAEHGEELVSAIVVLDGVPGKGERNKSTAE
ncbi:MAG: hypothetical protein Q9163_003631, partial [Psora crenata]